MVSRCSWAGDDSIYIQYHDIEWGVPVHDDRLLFEFLILEGAQAGLSWITILKKRENYRNAFDNFDFKVIAYYDDKKLDELMNDKGIIRNRRKIEAAVLNARGVLGIIDEFGSFDKYIWKFVSWKPVDNHWNDISDVPASTAESETMSSELKKRGFRFVGPTICYSFMQAVGMVNDHVSSCFRHDEILRNFR